MLTTLFSFLSTVIVGVLSAWLKDRQANTDAKTVGALTAEVNANAVATQAAKASDAVKPLTADELSKHNASNDPDFRD